ncbi:MAG: DUF3052 domain-containing protein [Alphaproteobacteria bacterium PA2]|nr:MAG: DUF3052 domain-containing protein [Alphaproteobacteria bacterium PA2]
MGKEAEVPAVFPDGEDLGRLQLEGARLIFRGAARRVYDGEALLGVSAMGGDLILPDGARFRLGEKQASAWADAILNPKTRLDKLGVKPGMAVAIRNVDDDALVDELTARGVTLVDTRFDILFYGADTVAEVQGLAGLMEVMAPKAAVWIVSRKGKAATIKDVEVMTAAKALGLVDSRVVGFSPTLTALRFTKRRP